MKQKNVLETTKRPYGIILFAALTIVFLLLAFIFSKMSLVEGRSFDDDKNTIYTTVNIDITNLPIAFETIAKGENETFYFADNNGNEYILKLNEKQYKKIQEEYEKNGADFEYHIVGRTYPIFDNLEKASQNTYNDNKGEEIITSLNYEEYFGQAYIDGTENMGMIVGGVFSILGCVMAVVVLICIIEYIHTIIKLNRAIKEYGKEKLEKLLNDSETISYQNVGAYLTKQYLISNSVDFKVISYDNIFWMYLLNKRMNFISIGIFIMVATKDGKCQPVVCGRNKKMLEKIMIEICEKNPNIRLGYTKENQKSYKDYLRQNK